MDANLDTLLTALYVKIDDMLVKDRRPGHPVRLSPVGFKYSATGADLRLGE